MLSSRMFVCLSVLEGLSEVPDDYQSMFKCRIAWPESDAKRPKFAMFDVAPKAPPQQIKREHVLSGNIKATNDRNSSQKHQTQQVK